MSLYPEHILVKKCLKLIEERLQWGHPENWHNDVFIELSEKIREETSVLLSATTLKRVWGKVKYDSAPSISTLNALSQFAGFDNWRDFKNNNEVLEKESWFQKNVHPNTHIIITLGIVLALGFISIYSVFDASETRPTVNFSNIRFSSQPITKGLPNSVVFNFYLDSIVSDSIYIQQSWDATKTFKVQSFQKQATGIYYYPGYFRSKLLIEGEIIREHDLFITSQGWMGTIDYKPIPKYILKRELLNDEIAFSETLLGEIMNSENPLQSSFHYVDNFRNVSGDNIRITQSVKSVLNDKWAVCQSLRILILGTEGAMVVPFSQLGCVSDLGLLLSDVYLSGKEHDLSAFGVNLNENTNIIITVKNKAVSIYIDEKKIYEGQYNKSIGRFVGMRYRFLGAGQINSFEFTDLNTKTAFLESTFTK